MTTPEREEVAARDAECDRLIAQRDATELALGDAYAAATGKEPDWSSRFGNREAVAGVRDATATLRARVAELEALKCETCKGTGWVDLPGGHDETPCRQCNARVVEIVDENYRLRKALYRDDLREPLKAELDGAYPTPDPCDARIAELEAALREVIERVGDAVLDFGVVDCDESAAALSAPLIQARRALGDDHG